MSENQTEPRVAFLAFAAEQLSVVEALVPKGNRGLWPTKDYEGKIICGPDQRVTAVCVGFSEDTIATLERNRVNVMVGIPASQFTLD